MDDKNNHWFAHLIDSEVVDSVNTIRYVKELIVNANLTKDLIPLSMLASLTLYCR